MSFLTEAAKSVNDARVLIEVDVTIENDQWVNNGAGIWVYNLDKTYSWVDASLFDASWVASSLQNVGSAQSDGLRLSRVTDASALTPLEFLWDAANSNLYICLQNYDEPFIHDVRVGLVYGFSHDEFTPSGMGSSQLYEGRLTGTPTVSLGRDPLFFGRLRYGGGSFDITNQDGEYDTFAQDNNLYGNEVRFRLGFESLDYDDYERTFTGYVDDVDVGEDTVHFSVADRRKSLSKEITYSCTNKAAMDAVKEILTTYFSASFDTDYFDVTTWNTQAGKFDARVTIDMQTSEPAIDVIEDLCVAAICVFFITPDNKYSCMSVSGSLSSATTIPASDVISKGRMHYGTTEVISSLYVGYAKDWATTGTAYTRKVYDAHEASVYTAYQIYNQQSFDMVLTTEAVATKWVANFYPMFTTVRGEIDVVLPIAYYDKKLEESFYIPIDRPQQTMLGTVDTVINSITWMMDRIPTIRYGLKETI